MSTGATSPAAPSAWRDPVALLAAPAVLYLLVVYALPLLWLLAKSFAGPDGLTLRPYVDFMSDPFNWRVIGNTLGATPFYRFTRIFLPLTLPGVVSGVAFVFSMSVSMYVIPSLLIGDRFQTLATLTGRSFLMMRNEQLGSTTAVILLVLAVSIVVGSTWLARRLGGST